MATGKSGTTRCGTMSGYNAHYRHGQKPCPACRAHATDWNRAKYLRAKSDYRLSMSEALTQLGLPADRIPAQVAHA